jgi:hypothetical protein
MQDQFHRHGTTRPDDHRTTHRKLLRMATKLIKQWFGGITLLTVSIESRRKKLLQDHEVIELLRLAHISGGLGESFESFMKEVQR